MKTSITIDGTLSTDGFPSGKYKGSTPVSNEELAREQNREMIRERYRKFEAPKTMPILLGWSPCGVPVDMYRGNNK